MEAPPPPPLSAAATAPSDLADSVCSSPRSRQTDTDDAEFHPSGPPQKLRLMCSYGGHIFPRPHDKSLCYIGGDTRIVAIDRHTSLSDLHQRLSKTLALGHVFSLKYQLPNEDLDSLISVTTDEDIENMIEEYDRLSDSNGELKTRRLRLFLFPKSASVEEVLVEAASSKSEDWFLSALNGGKTTTTSVSATDRGLSESSSVNCLLGLDDDLSGKSGVVLKDVETQILGTEGGGNENGNSNNTSIVNQDVRPVPDSPMLETSSSFDSASSTPSMSNLPPIRVREEENPKVGGSGIDEHFQQMTVGAVGVGGKVNLPQQKPEEAVSFLAAGTVVSGLPVMFGGDYSNDERSDHGGHRMAPQIPQPVPVQSQLHQMPQYQQKLAGAIDLASPDSVSSDGSITNTLSRQREAIYQEQIMPIQSGNNAVATNLVDLKAGDQSNSRVQMQPQNQDSGYVLSGQFDHNHPQLHIPQQFIQTSMQYVPTGAVPIASYYPVYPSQQQHHPHQPMGMPNQQYPVYFVPARQAQTYNLPVQPRNYNELAPTAASGQSQTPPPTTMAPLAAYNLERNALPQPEIITGVYRTTAGAAAQLVQVPSSQRQAQYVGLTQIIHPSQSVVPASAANSTYTCEYTDPMHAQIHSSQSFQPQLAAQYRTLTSTSAVVLPEAPTQLPAEINKQQIRTSQP